MFAQTFLPNAFAGEAIETSADAAVVDQENPLAWGWSMAGPS
jgi:hypothetical protein